MSFSASDVKSLREKTGCGMMECKKALTESNGNMEDAVKYLREKGLAAAAKKADRVAAEGIVFSKVSNKTGVILEINSETDFVAKNEQFKKFVETVADTILETKPKDLENLQSTKASGYDMTIGELLSDNILTIGEKIEIRRFVISEGQLTSYIHGGGTHAVLLNMETDDSVAKTEDFKALGKDIAMHIAASNPLYLEESQIPGDVVEKEKEILTKQAMNEGKPENIAQKMVIGRIKKFLKDICLVDQPFVKNPDITISQHVSNVASNLSANIKLLGFVRYEIGEGIEKKQGNFADEVANMVK